MARRAQDKNVIALKYKANIAASFLFSTVVRGGTTILAGALYAACEALGLPVLPISMLLVSPLEHSWTLSLTTTGTILLIYSIVSVIFTGVMMICFNASSGFRKHFGYQYHSGVEDGENNIPEKHD